MKNQLFNYILFILSYLEEVKLKNLEKITLYRSIA